MRALQKPILIALLCMTLLVAPLLAFYGHYEKMANSLIRDKNMYYETANAVKHAYAAGQLFTLLNTVMSDNAAEQCVLMLGNANEYFEQTVRSAKDSTPEILRDLSNNQMGITAARWHTTHTPPMHLRDVITRMASQQVILTRERSVKMPATQRHLKGYASVRAAIDDFHKTRAHVIRRAEAALVSYHE